VDGQLVVAAPKTIDADNLSDYLLKMSNGKKIICASEYPLIANKKISNDKAYRKLFGDKKPVIVTKYGKIGENDMLEIFESDGATESGVNVPFESMRSADFIIETKGSGKTLEDNGLKTIETVIETYAGVYTTSKILSDQRKAEEIERIVNILR